MKILLVGDVMLGRLVNEYLKSRPAAYPWGDPLALFQEAQLRLCNLECVLADQGSPWFKTPKTFYFRSDAQNIEVLKSARIDLVSLANNHVLDFEDEALEEMLELLRQAGIGYAGAGLNWEQASTPAYREVEGLKLGFLAFCDHEAQWEAKEKQPGIFYVPVDLKDARTQILLTRVREAKPGVDILIVSAHWGSNWGYIPAGEQIPFARALIDAGADIIFGHSGHVVRGVEIYKQRPIIYCAGDFIDDYAVDAAERNDRSFIFMIETEKEKISRLLLYPTVIGNFQARMAPGPEQKTIARMMQELCRKMDTEAHWREEKGFLEISMAK